jgi:hypothetical protein
VNKTIKKFLQLVEIYGEARLWDYDKITVPGTGFGIGKVKDGYVWNGYVILMSQPSSPSLTAFAQRSLKTWSLWRARKIVRALKRQYQC